MKKWTGEPMILASQKNSDGFEFTFQKMPFDRQWIYERMTRILKQAKSLDDATPIAGHPTSWRQYLLMLLEMLKGDDRDNAEMLEAGRASFQGANKADARNHGTEADQLANRIAYQNHLDAQHTRYPNLTYNALCSMTADRFKVSPRTVKRYTRNPITTV